MSVRVDRWLTFLFHLISTIILYYYLKRTCLNQKSISVLSKFEFFGPPKTINKYIYHKL
jgi:hypothetical protein